MRVSYLRIGAIKSDLGLGKVKLTTTLNIFAMGILLLCGAGIALTLWNARESERHLQRTTLANESYIHHLKLSKGVYRLLNRMADEELGHSLSGREDKKAIVAQLQADLTVIRRIIGNEIDLVGEEEIEELELLAEVELKVMSLIDIADAPTDAGLASRWLEATRSLNEGAMQAGITACQDLSTVRNRTATPIGYPPAGMLNDRNQCSDVVDLQTGLQALRTTRRSRRSLVEVCSGT